MIVPLPAAVVDNRGAFAALAGEAALARVVRSVLGPRRRIVVAAANQLADEVRECLSAHELASVTVAVVEGSADRRECVKTALEHLGGESIPTPLVLVHDHRYPLAPSDVCDRVIERLRDGSPVVFRLAAHRQRQGRRPARPDHRHGRSLDPANRAVSAGFTADRLASLAATCPTDDFDEVEESIRAGLTITVVDGDPDAFLVDLPRDGQLVEAIISTRRAEPR